MTQTVFEKMKTAISVLKLDFTTEEFATFADDQELSEEAIEAVQTVFSYSSCGARASAGRNWIQFLYRLAK